MTRIPDLTEPIIGYRMFGIISPGFLCSPVAPRIWLPREANKATCDYQTHDHSPSRQCACGFYAWNDKHVFGVAPHFFSVKLWGHVIKHQHGYRAEYAYPFEIYTGGIGDPMIRSVVDRYGLIVKPLPKPANSLLAGQQVSAQPFSPVHYKVSYFHQTRTTGSDAAA